MPPCTRLHRPDGVVRLFDAAHHPRRRERRHGSPRPVLEWRDYREVAMAKGEMKGNKEAKKPKADKPKGPGSSYKQSQGKGGPATIPPAKKT